MGQAYLPQEPFQGRHSCAVSPDLSRHSGGPTSAVTVLADSLLGEGGGVGTHAWEYPCAPPEALAAAPQPVPSGSSATSPTGWLPRAELVELTVFCPLCSERTKVCAVAAAAAEAQPGGFGTCTRHSQLLKMLLLEARVALEVLNEIPVHNELNSKEQVCSVNIKHDCSL